MSQKTGIRVLKGFALWVPTLVLAAFFSMQGVMKLDPHTPWGEMFANWGYPSGSHLVIGVVELLAGIALLIPRFAAYAAATLALVMLGAAATHLIHAEWMNVGVTFVLCAAFTVLARVRESRRWRPRESAAGTP